MKFTRASLVWHGFKLQTSLTYATGHTECYHCTEQYLPSMCQKYLAFATHTFRTQDICTTLINLLRTNVHNAGTPCGSALNSTTTTTGAHSAQLQFTLSHSLYTLVTIPVHTQSLTVHTLHNFSSHSATHCTHSSQLQFTLSHSLLRSTVISVTNGP